MILLFRKVIVIHKSSLILLLTNILALYIRLIAPKSFSFVFLSTTKKNFVTIVYLLMYSLMLPVTRAITIKDLWLCIIVFLVKDFYWLKTLMLSREREIKGAKSWWRYVLTSVARPFLLLFYIIFRYMLLNLFNWDVFCWF